MFYAHILTFRCLDGEWNKHGSEGDLPYCHVPKQRGGGAKIRLSTRLNKPKASRYPLVITFPNPAHLCVTRHSLAERAVSGEAGGVSLVASFIR